MNHAEQFAKEGGSLSFSFHYGEVSKSHALHHLIHVPLGCVGRIHADITIHLFLNLLVTPFLRCQLRLCMAFSLITSCMVFSTSSPLAFAYSSLTYLIRSSLSVHLTKSSFASVSVSCFEVLWVIRLMSITEIS